MKPIRWISSTWPSFEAPDCSEITAQMLQLHEAVDLLTGHWKLFDYLLNSHTSLKVLKQTLHWRPGSTQHPRATYLTRNAFHGGTLRPIESCHVLNLFLP
jgi:hypothetical protein